MSAVRVEPRTGATRGECSASELVLHVRTFTPLSELAGPLHRMER